MRELTLYYCDHLHTKKGAACYFFPDIISHDDNEHSALRRKSITILKSILISIRKLNFPKIPFQTIFDYNFPIYSDR